MKKLLSIILTVCMLFSLVIVPVTVNAVDPEDAYAESTLGGYYKFTFDGGEDSYDYVVSSNSVTDTTGQQEYKNGTFFPLWIDSANKANATAEYKTITLSDDSTVKVLEIKNLANAFFTPVTADGQPFEMHPGVEYMVKINGFNPASAPWTQVMTIAGTNTEKNKTNVAGQAINASTGVATDKVTAAYEAIRSASGGAVNGSQYGVWLKDGTYKRTRIAVGTINQHFAEFKETSRYVQPNIMLDGSDVTRTPINVSIDKSFFNEYDAENQRYTTKFKVDGSEDEYITNSNYLAFSFGGGDAVSHKANTGTVPVFSNATKEEIEEAGKVPSCWQIESIEVYEKGYAAVNYHTGDDVKIVKGTAGDTAELYIPEASEGKYFVGWYADADYTTLVSSAVEFVEGAVDLYARFESYKSTMVQEFKNYPAGTWKSSTKAPAAYMYNNSYVSTVQVVGWAIQDYGTTLYSLDKGSVGLSQPCSWPQSGTLLFLNEDGTPFVPKPNTKYKVTLSARMSSKVQNATTQSVVVSVGSGKSASVANSFDDTSFNKSSSAITFDTVSKEYKDYDFYVTTPAISDSIVPCLGLYSSPGATKDFVSKLTEEPEDWAENYTAYYFMDDSIGDYARITGDEAPVFAAGEYYNIAVETNRDKTNHFNTVQVRKVTVEEVITHTVTFKYLNGTEKTQSYDNGAAIAPPALAADINYDHVWSKSDREYIPIDPTAKESITVYEYKNDVLSFENGVEFDYNGNKYENTVPSTEYAKSGYKSVKNTNTASNHVTQGNTPIRVLEKWSGDYDKQYDFDYKITFKYLTTEKNTAASSFTAAIYTYNNLWNGLTKGGRPSMPSGGSNANLKVVGVDIPACATDGWQTAEMYVSHHGTIFTNDAAATPRLYLKFNGAAKEGDAITNEVFVDDLVIEDVDAVTFVPYSGSQSVGYYNVGETIAYPTTPKSYNDHYVWSTDPDTYVPAPPTANGSLTVFQIKSDVNSFQNDIPTDPYMFKTQVPSVQYSSEGEGDHRAMRVRNYGVAERPSKRADWGNDPLKTYPEWNENAAIAHMYYDAESDSYKNITAEMFNEFGEGDEAYEAFYAKYRVYERRKGANKEQANLPVYQFNAASTSITQNFKISFKYKFTEKNSGNDVKVFGTLGNHDNIWNGYVELSDQYIVLPYSDSDEWQTATLYTVINNKSVNDKSALFALKFADAVNADNMSTFEILVDDVVMEDFNATSFSDGESYKTDVALQHGHTYKVSFKYLTTAAHDAFGFDFLACNENNVEITDGVQGSMTVAAGGVTNGWVTKNAYFTADLTGVVADEDEKGLDYKVTWSPNNYLYMTFTQDAVEAGNDLYFTNIEIVDLGEVIDAVGASILTDTAAQNAEMQAMRFYFDYKTVDGSTIELGKGEILTVVERGFIYRNGSADKDNDSYIDEGASVKHFTLSDATVREKKENAFNQCWAYNETTSMMRFSTYVTGFGLVNDFRKLEVKGYIIAEDGDGNRFTLYANSINRTVEGVKSYGDMPFDENISDGLPQQ